MGTKAATFLLLVGWATVASTAEQETPSRPQRLRDPELYSLYHSDFDTMRNIPAPHTEQTPR